MSSTAFKNAVRRREHYERSQPNARKKYGLLEKHKDYVKRARNYHDKEKRIHVLREKAANRNPDEFYFKMNSQATKDGVHASTSERPALTGDMLLLLKSQDKAYIQTKKNSEDKRIERLKSSLHMLSAEPQNTHTVFVDDEEELTAFDAAEYFDTDPALVGRAFNRPHKAALAAGALAPPEPPADDPAALKAAKKDRKRADRAREGAYAELEDRVDRSAKMARLTEHMELEQALLKKGRRVKVADAVGDAPAVFRWKAQRKR